MVFKFVYFPAQKMLAWGLIAKIILPEEKDCQQWLVCCQFLRSNAYFVNAGKNNDGITMLATQLVKKKKIGINHLILAKVL
jgi:hypothetical protein